MLTLHDAATGASAEILPNLGFNCYRFRTQHGGEAVDWLWSDPNFASGSEKPSRSGIPILFPFPGRIADGKYAWQGKEYALSGPWDDFGNAIHGFVHLRPWRVVEQAEDSATGEFHAATDDPSLLAEWPSDFRIRARYDLAGVTLRLTVTIDNPGSSELPFTLGMHPYFRVPQGGPSADHCRVRFHVAEAWELNNLIPTGRREPVADAQLYASGQPFGQLHIDSVFRVAPGETAAFEGSVEDPGSGRKLAIRADSVFRECVVFTPPHRQAICIEPYTGAPGAIQLRERGVDAGLRLLAPGESFTATMELAAS